MIIIQLLCCTCGSRRVELEETFDASYERLHEAVPRPVPAVTLQHNAKWTVCKTNPGLEKFTVLILQLLLTNLTSEVISCTFNTNYLLLNVKVEIYSFKMSFQSHTHNVYFYK